MVRDGHYRQRHRTGLHRYRHEHGIDQRRGASSEHFGENPGGTVGHPGGFQGERCVSREQGERLRVWRDLDCGWGVDGALTPEVGVSQNPGIASRYHPREFGPLYFIHHQYRISLGGPLSSRCQPRPL